MTLRKIAVLESDIQAQRLSEILEDMGIPHIIRSHHDSVLDGLLQFSTGWGHVEAPEECADSVRQALADLALSCDGCGQAADPADIGQ